MGAFSYNGDPKRYPTWVSDEALGAPSRPVRRGTAGRCKEEMRCFTTGAITSSRLKLRLAKILALKNLSARGEPATAAERCLNRSNQRTTRDLKVLASPLAVASPNAYGSALWVNQ